MNWVGGSRNRFMLKNDAKKQKEFFEKRKMQQKLNKLGIPLSSSARSSSSGGMDMVTLFIVNQIASKKENKDPPKVSLFSESKGGSKMMKNASLVLPMSPGPPSRLNLVESQPHCSFQGVKKRKHCIPQGFRCGQLSPVLESAFSDNSEADYLPPVADPLSPFSTSSASSGQGIFPLHPNLQQREQTQAQPPPQCSPTPWDISGHEKAEPRSVRDCTPWSSGSNTPIYQLQTPTVARVPFGSPDPDNTETRVHAGHHVMFSLDPPEDKEPVLGFSLNQSETEEPFEQEVFRGFNDEEYRREDSHFWEEKSKICLTEETPIRPPRALQFSPTPVRKVLDSQCRSPEVNSLTQLCDHTDMDSSYSGDNNGSLHKCGFLSSYSCRGSFLSSDSDDDEDRCQQCLPACPSCTDRPCCAEIPNPIQVVPEQQHHRGLNVKENMACSDEACGGSEKQTAQFVSAHPLHESQSSQMHKCKTASHESRDVGTQTDDIPARQTCDAETQCILLSDRAPMFILDKTPVDVSIQKPATRRQTGCRDAATEQSASSDDCRRGGEHPPRSKPRKKSRAGHLSVSGIANNYPNRKSDSRVIKGKPTICFIDTPDMTDHEINKQDGGGRQDLMENSPLMKDLPEEEKEEVTSASSITRL